MERQQHPTSNEAGFTLLQLAISVMILGILLAGGAQAYSIYLRQEQIRTTDENIKYVINELQRFKQLKGRFPCPAPLSAPREDASYGAETDCLNTSVAPGGGAPTSGATGENGVAIALSAKAGLAAPRVRIGAVPFRILNLEENSAYDGYGSRLVYVLTESMANRDTYNAREGGIGILKADLTSSAIDPADSAVFALLSPGKDKAGAFDRQGNFTAACSAGAIDTENCDFGANARLSVSLESHGTGGSYDDRISYFAEQADTMWARNETTPENIGDVAQGNIGVGKDDPEARLDIADASAGSGPEGTLRASTEVQTDRICPSDHPGTDANCFEPRNIAGDNSTNPANNTPGEGMKCPSGAYMTGIQDGRAICGDIEVKCPNTTDIIGNVNPTTGAVTCDSVCSQEPRDICGTEQTLPMTRVTSPSTTITLTGGNTGTYTERWRCRRISGVPTWQFRDSTGSCECTPGVETDGGVECGYGFTGTYTRTITTTCPDGNREVTDDFASQCTCTNVPPYVETYDCPNENEIGNITYTWNWICPDAYWSDPTIVNTCACDVPAETTRQEVRDDECPTGETGTVTHNYEFNTSICNWEEVDAVDSCTCDTSLTETDQQDPSCQPWEYVEHQATFTRYHTGENCTWTDWQQTAPGTCQPRTYIWKIISSPGGSPVNSPVGPMVGSSTGCNYSVYTAGTEQNCSSPSGSQFQVHKCQCLPAN